MSAVTWMELEAARRRETVRADMAEARGAARPATDRRADWSAVATLASAMLASGARLVRG